MSFVRPQQNYVLENQDDDIEGSQMSKVKYRTANEAWKFFVNYHRDLNIKNVYISPSSSRLIPLGVNDETFILRKGLVLFHVTVHLSDVEFDYPNKEPFFSTTPSHGLAIAFEPDEKRKLVIEKGYIARLIIYILKKDLICVDNCGDCERMNKGEEAAVAGTYRGRNVQSNLNEIRLYKSSEEKVKECLEYVTEIDLTKYILEKNPYTLYGYGEYLEMMKNRDYILPPPLPEYLYKEYGWKPVTSQLGAMTLFASILLDEEVPEIVALSLFLSNQIWVLGDYDPEESNDDKDDVAIFCEQAGEHKLIFLSDYISSKKRFGIEARKKLEEEIDRFYFK